MSIIFGLGSGRSGTSSLASLINSQNNAVCFHEINASGMAWSGAETTVLSLLQDFWTALDGGPRAVSADYTSAGCAKQVSQYLDAPALHHVGDVASYYLPYVEYILSLDANVRFPCLKRDREATVQSFVSKLRISGDISRRHRLLDWLSSRIPGIRPLRSRNHWAAAGHGRWATDLKWDKTFPQFSGVESVEDGARRYWDHYYETAEALEITYPENVKAFDLDRLNHLDGQRAILEFCGIEEELKLGHTHRLNASPQPQ